MNGVIGMLELALRTELTHEQRRQLRLARESAESLLIVLNEILDFSKIDAGRVELREEVFVLEDSLESIVESASLLASGKGSTCSSSSTRASPGRPGRRGAHPAGPGQPDQQRGSLHGGGLGSRARGAGRPGRGVGPGCGSACTTRASGCRPTSKPPSSSRSVRPTAPSPAATGGPAWGSPSRRAWWTPWRGASTSRARRARGARSRSRCGWGSPSAGPRPTAPPTSAKGCRSSRPCGSWWPRTTGSTASSWSACSSPSATRSTSRPAAPRPWLPWRPIPGGSTWS